MKWHACTTNRGSAHEQCLIIDDTGANIAVSYDAQHAPLIAAAPDLLAVVKSLFYDINGLNTTLRATNGTYASSTLCERLTQTVGAASLAIAKAT